MASFLKKLLIFKFREESVCSPEIATRKVWKMAVFFNNGLCHSGS